jgi:hypothetical protein
MLVDASLLLFAVDQRRPFTGVLATMRQPVRRRRAAPMRESAMP